MAAGPVLRLLVRFLVPERHREFVLGDLEELHVVRAQRDGRAVAHLRYVLDAFSTLVAFRMPGQWRAREGRPRAQGSGGRGGGEGPSPQIPRRRTPLSESWGDLRAAVRSLRRRPAFTAVAAATLAIGVGSAAAGFGMVNQLLLRPLPGVADPGEAAYVRFFSKEDPDDETAIALLDFDALRRGATLVEGIGLYRSSTLHVSMNEERPVEVEANVIYGDFFEVLGVVPAAGRLLSAEETTLGADPFVAVISGRLWGSLFGGAPDVVGRTFRASGKTLTVVGVAGGGFSGPERGDAMDVWVPYSTAYVLAEVPVDRMLDREAIIADNLLARPREDVTPQAVERHLTGVLERIVGATPESAEHLAGVRPRVFPGLHAPPRWRENTYGSLALVGGVVGLVLLIACANVANLLLFRGVGRRGEVATRRALGASSGRVARQHLAESLIIAGLGTAIGLGVGWIIAFPFRGQSLVRMPPFEGLVLDGRVLLFASASVLLTAVFFGTMPALLAGRFDLGDALRDAGGRETGRQAGFRGAMSATQIALSLMLLVGAFLLVRTVGNLYEVDTGLSIDRVATLTLDVGDVPEEEQDALHRAVLAAAEAVPGVEAAALDIYGPHSAGMIGRARLPDAAEDDRVRADMTLVTPGWFEVLGVESVSGRTFRPEDWGPGAPPRLMVTAGLARRLFGTSEVVGRRLVAGFGTMVEGEIVGVVEDLRLAGPEDEPDPTFFQPYAPFGISYVTVLARTRVLDRTTLDGIREAVEATVPDLPVPEAVPLVDRIHSRLEEQRTFARMVTLLASLAALLAAVGLYGVVAFTVAGRRRELGIRLALGADGPKIVGLVARYALGIVGLGTAAGLAAAYGLSRLVESRLFGVAPTDPWSYAGSALLFAAVAAAACWTPTRSAMRVDPVVTLRSE